MMIIELSKLIDSWLSGDSKRSYRLLENITGVHYSAIRRIHLKEVSSCDTQKATIPIIQALLTYDEMVSFLKANCSAYWKANHFLFAPSLDCQKEKIDVEAADLFIKTNASRKTGVALATVLDIFGRGPGQDRVTYLLETDQIFSEKGRLYSTKTSRQLSDQVTNENISELARSYNKLAMPGSANFNLNTALTVPLFENVKSSFNQAVIVAGEAVEEMDKIRDKTKEKQIPVSFACMVFKHEEGE